MKRFAAIAFSVLMVAMMLLPTALADEVNYKSSYVLADFPSGAGTPTHTGSDYGVYGGLILGDVNPSNIEYLGVSGKYDSATGDYIVTYQVTLTERPMTESAVMYVAVARPVGVTLYTRPKYLTLNWTQCDSSSLYYFTGKKPTMAFDLSSYYPADTDCYAVPIYKAHFGGDGKTALLDIRISDPLAVAQLKGTGKFIDTILYPFTTVTENIFVVNFVASIWRTPLIAPFFTLALSALALGLIVKFMR